MLDLDHFEQFCNRLTLKDRDSGEMVPFRFNPSQQKIMAKVRAHQSKHRHLWMIFLKARRLGISRWTAGLALAHCLQKVNAHARVVGQLTETSKEMYDQVGQFADQLPIRLPPRTQREMLFPHSGGVSRFSRATAKTVIGGRGLTHSFLHLTEAAFYPGEDSFVALLNTVSAADPDNIVVVETTAHGVEGDGAAYYNYWQAAVAEENEFLAIFLPWWEDPASRLPDKYAPDAPADDYERWLMEEFRCTRGQIAWFRSTLETKCGGSIYTWKQEYPASPDEAFIASGEPVFDFKELEYMRQSCQDPILKGDILGAPKSLKMVEQPEGPLYVWEEPHDLDHYYVGCDAAKGTETGDFAALVGWNAETGRQAFSYVARIGSERLAELAEWLCRRYNKAMINVELTGGWGYSVMKDLRDKYHYPNQYLWRSRDDKPDTKPRQAFGWETTDRSRQMLFNTFRKAVRASLPRDYGDGRAVSRPEVIVRDIRLYAQASRAQSDIGFRWRVLEGHDDILMAAWLGFIALAHYHLPHPDYRTVHNTLANAEPRLPFTYDDSPEATTDGVLGIYSTDHLRRVLHFRDARERRRSETSERLLEGT
jgi:hypothetical protein